MVPLHIHTSYSLLQSPIPVKKLAERGAELGYRAIGISDLGNLFGAIEFYKGCQKNGIKPIIGTEVFITPTEPGEAPTRLLLYAANNAGYKNLLYLSSISYLYHYKPVEERGDPIPQVPLSEIEEKQEGLILILPMLEGEVGFHLNLWNEVNLHSGAKGAEEALKRAFQWRKRFDNLYLEIRRDSQLERLLEPALLQIGKEAEIPVVAQSAVYYLDQSDSIFSDALKCIGSNLQFDDIHRDIETADRHLRTPEEFEALFADLPEAIEESDRIAEQVELELELDNPTPPTFKFTKEYAQKEGLDIDNDVDYFVHKCWEGLEERLKNIPPDQHQIYRDRLQYEIDVIKRMKFPGYMLIVWDFINYAKDPSRHFPEYREKHGDKPIPVGPGRGSAAGSLVAYALKITNIDPIKYGLLFERFLNPERVTLPDIDVDFCQERREEVLEYVKRKYGELNVAQVITFQSLLAKGVLRDIARIFGIPYGKADAFAKLVPEKAKNLKQARQMEPKIEEILKKNPLYDRLYQFGERLEGAKRGTGTHAAGVVISDIPIWEKSPVYKADPSDSMMTTQYSLEYLESVDLIKFDFLGLKTLTIIQRCLDWIKETTGEVIDLEQLSVDDPEVYKLISSGKTLGLFQIESEGMRNLAVRLQPTTFDDIIAMLALYRPGPMEAGMLDDYIERKHGRQPVSYFFDEFEEVLKPILEPTYGVIVYQEQVMQIVQAIGGFSLGEADIIRRAMGKKKEDLIKKYGEEFSQRAAKRGFSYENARALYDLIEKFAGYGFNKSHSAAYAMVTYQTAYLKRYYPTQFFAALLTYETNNTDKMALYIEEAKSLGIEVLPPDIALSHGQFTPTERGILFGLNGIKGVGEKAVQNIEESRPFSNLQEFIEKVDINKVNRKVLEQLIKAGAMDRFGYTRQTLFRNIDRMLEYRRKLDEYYTSLNNSSSLFNGFGEATPPPDFKLELEQFPEWDTYTLLENEYSALGFYISGHPLDPFRDQLKKLDYNLSSEVKELIGGEGLFVGKVAAKKRKISRKGTPYLSLTLVDYHGKLEIFLFREVIDQLEQLDLEKPIAVKASVDGSGDKVKLVARKVMGLEEAQRERKGKKRRERQIFYRLTPNYKVELAQIARQLERWQEQYPGPDEIKIEVETPFGYLVRFLTSYRLDWESLSKLDTSHLSPLPIFKG